MVLLISHDESLAYRCPPAPIYGVCDSEYSEYKFYFHEIILSDQRDLWTNFRISLGITNAHSTVYHHLEFGTETCVFRTWDQDGRGAFPELNRRILKLEEKNRVVSCSGSCMEFLSIKRTMFRSGAETGKTAADIACSLNERLQSSEDRCDPSPISFIKPNV